VYKREYACKSYPTQQTQRTNKPNEQTDKLIDQQPASRLTADTRNFTSIALMIAPEMKIEPGRCVVQFPHAWRYATLAKLGYQAMGGQSIMGPKPDTMSIRVDFTHAMAAAAAGAVASVLGASRFRT
jgi:hypothetical protein